MRSLTASEEQGVIRSRTVLRLAGIKGTFQASSTFWFQPVQGLCACGQHFPSGGGLLPVKPLRSVCQAFICSFSELEVR